MKRRNVTSIAVVAVLVATFAWAQVPPGPPGAPPEQGNNPLFEFLGLTAEQITAWQGLIQAHHEETLPAGEELRALHEDLRLALEAEVRDANAIGSIMIAIDDHRDIMQAKREELEAALSALLNPEQLIRYEAFKAAQAFLNRPQGPGPGGPGGPGGGPGRGSHCPGGPNC